MTITDISTARVPQQREADTKATPESVHVTRLRAMLTDEAERENWPEIQRAIDYLIGKTFVADLAA